MKQLDHHEPASDCDAISELVAEYAFGLTSPDESRLVESRLPYCPDAAQQLADFRRLQDEMRASVTQVEPPRELGERLMAAAGTAVRPVTRQPTLRLSPAWLAAAAAVVLLIVTNAYWLGRTQGGVEVQDGNVPFVVQSASNLHWVRLVDQENDTPAAAFLMWNDDSDIGLMYVVNFPPLSAGNIYQLWLTRDGERTKAGTFKVDETGEAAMVFNAVEPIDEFTWAWITEEPITGSDQPSDAVITGGEL